MRKHEILDRIQTPEDVKKLKGEQLPQLCRELREEIVDAVSHNGGHLAPNLGVVELTVALHRVFDMPKDKLIFDVGASNIKFAPTRPSIIYLKVP